MVDRYSRALLSSAASPKAGLQEGPDQDPENIQPALSNSHLVAGTHPRANLIVAASSSLLWMLVSSWLIVVNKQLLSGGFAYPMALSGLGMTFSGVASYFVCRVRIGWWCLWMGLCTQDDLYNEMHGAGEGRISNKKPFQGFEQKAWQETPAHTHTHAKRTTN